MFKKHFLVLLLILVASFALLSAQNYGAQYGSKNQANNMPQYVFHVYGVIVWFSNCGEIQPYTGNAKLEVTLQEGNTINIDIIVDYNGDYRETIYIGGTPISVKLSAGGKSISKPYTAGHGGEIELSLTIGNPPTNPLIPNQPNQN